MKTQFRLVALTLLIAAFTLAWASRIQGFCLSMALALELYALTELEINWREQIELRKLKAFFMRHNNSSISGVVAQIAAFLLLVAFFLL
ncbi:hypothetical protein [Massilia endophytica]|uniref:hypothetical protein n=1 Tax=Massilia endophytica TaxID=2899220 RepID=UPI001E541EB0|nr:hypothetical protein [Massilia endophytica]UGQ45509.1 hypothetical protein LSQ66_17190 [Massilia endophytica]